MSQRKKRPASSKPAPKPQDDIKAAAAQAAEAQRTPMAAYLRPFILFVAAAAVILFLISRLGGSGNDFPATDSAEAGFARDMVTHHQQAVQTAMIIRDRLPDDAPVQLDQFLWDIISTQQNQIGQMQAWLNVWGLTQGTVDPPMKWMGHEVTGLMPGMMTTEQVEELRTLPVDEAVVRFMELMIVHHLSAVDMAEAVLDKSDTQVVTSLADAIIRTQQGEIEVMNLWIERYSGAESSGPEATPSASPIASPEHDH